MEEMMAVTGFTVSLLLCTVLTFGSYIGVRLLREQGHMKRLADKQEQKLPVNLDEQLERFSEAYFK